MTRSYVEPKQLRNYTEFIALSVERLEDNPENWPTLDELPETDISDFVAAAAEVERQDHDYGV